MSAEYAISGIGVSGMMVSGLVDLKLLVQIGKYWLPAVSGIGESGLMASGCMTQGVSLKIIEWDNFKIEDSGLTAVPQATFNLVCDPDTAPQDGAPVVIAVGTLQNRLFGGYLVNPKLTEVTLDYVRYQCTALGWARDLEKRLIVGSWTNTYAGDILRAIMALYTPHFVCGGYVADGFMLADFRVDYQSLLDVCNDLASRCGFVFYLDPLREVHFHTPVMLTAPFNITDAARFGNPQISPDSSTLVNRVLVRYSELRSQTESFVGDGVKKDFQLLYAPEEVVTLTVASVAVTYDSRYAEDHSTNDFSIDYTRGGVTTSAHAILTAGQTLTIVYSARFPACLIRTHQASVIDRQAREGGDGYYDLFIEDRDIVSIADARARADAELDQYAWPRVSASYVRTEEIGAIFANRLQVGQRQRLQFWDYDAFLNIEKVTLEVLRPGDLGLIFIQSVSLGPQPRGLVDVLKAVTPKSDTLPVGDAELLYEEDYI